MKKHLKLWAFLLALLVALTAVLSACGTAKDDAEEDTEESETKKKNRPDYKGFSDDEAYRVSFHTDENGACVADIDFNPYYDEPFKLIIPDTDDKGNPVVSVSCDNRYAALPYMVPEEKMQDLMDAVLAYCGGDSNNFYFQKFMSYYQLKGLEFCSSDRLKQDLLDHYPIVEIANVYMFDPTATGVEYAVQATMLQRAYPKLKSNWFYELSQDMEKDCKKNGVEQEFPWLETYSGMGEYVTEIQWPSQISSVEIMTFFSCDRLKTLSIPGTIEKVEMYDFVGCPRLKDVTIEEGVKEIEVGALYGCDSLENIYLPSSLELLADVVCLERIMDHIVHLGQMKDWTSPEIHYNGTIEEWNQLIQNSIEQGWLPSDQSSSYLYEICTIHCTDGDISMDVYES